MEKIAVPMYFACKCSLLKFETMVPVKFMETAQKKIPVCNVFLIVLGFTPRSNVQVKWFLGFFSFQNVIEFIA